jgi:hypothetical protein
MPDTPCIFFFSLLWKSFEPDEVLRKKRSRLKNGAFDDAWKPAVYRFDGGVQRRALAKEIGLCGIGRSQCTELEGYELYFEARREQVVQQLSRCVLQALSLADRFRENATGVTRHRFTAAVQRQPDALAPFCLECRQCLVDHVDDNGPEFSRLRTGLIQHECFVDGPGWHVQRDTRLFFRVQQFKKPNSLEAELGVQVSPRELGGRLEMAVSKKLQLLY